MLIIKYSTVSVKTSGCQDTGSFKDPVSCKIEVN